MARISPEKEVGLNLAFTAGASGALFAGGAIVSYTSSAVGAAAATVSAVAGGALTALSTAFTMLGFSIAHYLYKKNIISLRTRDVIACSSLAVGIAATVALAFFLSVNPIHAAVFIAGGTYTAGFLLYNLLSVNRKHATS